MLRKLIQLLVRLLAVSLVLAVAAAIYLGSTTRMPGEANTALGQARQSSHYVTSDGGTRIAVDVWLPPDIQPGEQHPTLLRATRYWRGAEFSFWSRILRGAGIVPGLGIRPDTAYLNEQGFVVVVVDARGTGASEGVKPFPITQQETADYASVMDWVITRPWSNGKIGAFGVSYDGMTAEAMAEQMHPALKAIAPTYMVADSQFYLATLGGVLNREFMNNWQELNTRLDANEGLCKPGQSCWLFKRLFNGVKQVDNQPLEHIEYRVTPKVLDAARDTPFRDDPLAHNNELTWPEIASYGRWDEIARSGVGIFVLAGWLDAGSADGALSRYMSLSNAQEVIIGTLSHGGGLDTDPFKPLEANPEPSYNEQLVAMADFFTRYLGEKQPVPQRQIRYYTLNGKWKETATWPPAGRKEQTLYLCQHNELCAEQAAATASDSYPVDFTTTSSTLNQSRWDTPLGGSDVIYEDRRDLPGNRLSYTSPPLQHAMIITGSPVLHINIASSLTDGAIHAYLEHVAPNGKVTYVTEGAVRLTHALSAYCESCPYKSEGPNRSFLRSQQSPFTAGMSHAVELPLLATSVRFNAGDRLRVSLTGADAVQFARIPALGDPVWTVQTGGNNPSRITLPIEPESREVSP